MNSVKIDMTNQWIKDMIDESVEKAIKAHEHKDEQIAAKFKEITSRIMKEEMKPGGRLAK